MNDTPSPDGAQPEDTPASGFQPQPYDPQTPTPPDATLPPQTGETSGMTSPPPRYQPSTPSGFGAPPGFTPVAAPTTSARRRGPVWPWIVGAVAAVALIGGLGLVAGMAIQAARAATPLVTPIAHTQPEPGHKRGDGPEYPRLGGVLTVTGVNGNTITATLADGSTVTITVVSQTVITGMDHQPAQVSDITVGERIGVQPFSVSSSGAITAHQIVILPFTVGGTVAAVSATTITVVRGQQSQTINVTSLTAFKGAVTSLSGVMKGMRVMAQGPTMTNGALDATVVMAETPPVAGKVTAVTATSITVTDLQGTSQTIRVTPSTHYTSFSAWAAATPATTAASVQPGAYILARGTLDASGAFTAQTVTILPSPSVGGWGGPPNGSWPGAPNQPGQPYQSN